MSEGRNAPVNYTTKGFGTDPCPGCGETLKPGEPLTVRPGVWRPWHAVCFEAPAKRCACCGENHADGSCLL